MRHSSQRAGLALLLLPLGLPPGSFSITVYADVEATQSAKRQSEQTKDKKIPQDRKENSQSSLISSDPIQCCSVLLTGKCNI